MFLKNYAKIGSIIKKSKDGAGTIASISQKLHATDGYTFFRERESPAESSLKNR